MTITVSNCGTIRTWGIHMWGEEDRLTQGEMPSINIESITLAVLHLKAKKTQD